MAGDFDYFAVLAGMRTGSNLLEESLNAMPGIHCHGELFNPHFFGKPGRTSAFGLSMQARESDPIRVIGAMRSATKGFAGFRLFYDHDPRAIDRVLADPRAAKIILTRRPIDSYVSLKIARKTDQWWLGDMTTARAAKVPFDGEEYVEFLNTLAAFQHRIDHALQVTGQTAFRIGYADLADSDVLAGLGKFLGADGPPDPSKVRAKVQNPTRLSDRLSNARHAEETLRTLGTPEIGHVPHHEPGRGPGLKFFRACKTVPLVYMPIRGAGMDPVPDWLQRLEPSGELESGMTQKDFRRWKRLHPGNRSFTVLRHPLARAYDSFCRHLLPETEENYSDLRAALIDTYGVPLPAASDVSRDQVRDAFLAFLKFLRGNLGGQTSLRVDNTWATQSVLLHAIGQFVTPDRVVREPEMAQALGDLAQEVGLPGSGPVDTFKVDTPVPLSEIYGPDMEAACEEAYRRDYMMFGFAPWREIQAA